MKLIDLQPSFLRHSVEDGRRYHDALPSMAGANGVMFLCPRCTEDGQIAPHWVVCWDPSVSIAVKPGPGRWRMVGTDAADLSLVAGDALVRLGTCGAIFTVKAGEVQLCS